MIIFAHDHKLRYEDGKYFTQGGLADNITSRYTSLFGNLTIICRALQKKQNEKLSQIENPKVIVEAIHSASLLINNESKKRISEIVKSSDAVIVRLPSIIGELVYKYAKQHNKPIFCEVVTCPWDSLWNHSAKGKIMAPIMWYKTKKSVKNADYVLYVTKEFLQGRYPTNGISIGCSDVELKDTDPLVVERRKKKIETISDTKTITLGTLAAVDTRFKGQQYVIKAISYLKNKGFNLTYHLAGGGDNTFLKEEAKKNGVSDQIIFDGLVPHNQVFDWFHHLDLYIQPSEQEGLPRALVEAMSQATPCIASDAGGNPELLNPKFIFKRSSSMMIADLLESLTIVDLERSAEENYKQAQNYTKSNLEPQRIGFYTDFYNFVYNK